MLLYMSSSATMDIVAAVLSNGIQLTEDLQQHSVSFHSTIAMTLQLSRTGAAVSRSALRRQRPSVVTVKV